MAQRQLEQIEQELHRILERIPYARKLLEIRGINASPWLTYWAGQEI